MGLKYVEHIKSIALFLLILLSLALTFTIWTFTPTHEIIEPTTTVEMPISETKNTEEIVRPVKLLFHNDENVTGTSDQNDINVFVESLKNWQISNIRMVQDEATPATIKSYMHSSKRALVYYPGLVPLPVFDSINNIVDTTIPESSFDRLIIEWDAPANDRPALYFINTLSGRIYKGDLRVEDLYQFQTEVVDQAVDYNTYVTDDAIGVLPVYVQKDKVEKTSIGFLLDEISTSKFAEALLDSPELVFSADLKTQEYTDDSGAFMRENQNTKSIKYIQPKAETTDPAIPSDLLFDSLNYINAHGGWTDQYLYAGMNSVNQQIEYQLYVADLPVFSNSTTTNLELMWGIDDGVEQVYSYVRPAYQLDSEAEKRVVVLAAGEDVLKALGQMEEEERSTITDVTPAYHVTRSEDDSFIIFEPTWYVKTNGIWTELPTELTGGRELGLE
ncbi:YycH family regulatory protein [Planococcus halocryophilus]|uniref:YycH family regulatory protein n=1 Tax=Planococcus halocryophilus TaxID=1215089 RepID=UPI001F1022BF|nr:two-component system activity regulator YycH [Planococcus halocryophilus]